MAYALLQKDLEKPSEDALRRAFKSLAELTDLDADIVRDDAYGSLVGRLTLDQARTLQRALAGQGVEAEVVDEADLPVLPPAVRFSRVEPSDNALVILDALGRRRETPWGSVEVIAAGCVRMVERKRIVTERTKLAVGGISGYSFVMPIVVTDVTHKEYQKDKLVLELFCRDGDKPRRRRAFGDQFRYDHLGPRLHRSYAVNFARMAADVIGRATAARLNRGAAAIGEGRGHTYRYPSRHAFEEETVWLLWRGPEGSR